MARGRRSTPSRSTPSRASKLSASKSTSNDNYVLPKSRTWIYSTSPPDDDLLSSSSNNLGLGNGGGGSITSDGYELYLGARVQRPVVRSLPPNYSYFKDDVSNNNLGGVPESAVKLDADAEGGGEEGNGGEAMDVDSNDAAAVALKSEEGTPANDNDYDGINEVSFYLLFY